VQAAGKEHDKLVARILLQTLPELEGEVPGARERLGEAALADALAGVARGSYAKEALPGLLKEMALHGRGAREAAGALQLGGLSDEAAVRAAVRAVLVRNAALIEAKGERALSPLMGDVMKELRGKADGGLVSRVLREELAARLSGR
jgi:glutamyl-tRNA(Gln) amidotransferase subunit E